MPTRDERYPEEKQGPVSKRAEAFRQGILGRTMPGVPDGVRERLAMAEEISAELGGMERTIEGLCVPRGMVNTRERAPRA